MWTRISDPIIQRQLKILALKGQSNVPDSKLNQVGIYVYNMHTLISIKKKNLILNLILSLFYLPQNRL